jgi:hypothetical protein
VGTAHVLATAGGRLAAEEEALAPAELGMLWQSAADAEASHLVVVLDGAPVHGARNSLPPPLPPAGVQHTHRCAMRVGVGGLGAAVQATYDLVSAHTSNTLVLSELFTASAVSPVARRSAKVVAAMGGGT